jgi:endonuclease I
MRKLLLLLILYPVLSFAQPSPTYYNNAVGYSDATLKSKLFTIISTGSTDVGYDGLYTIYPTSDNTADGKVWDMYSTCTWTHGLKKCGNYIVVCDCYNREHSIPQSWFNSNPPMVSDAHHIYPTDGKVNGQRSNYPHGECATGLTLSGGKGKLGSSTYAGYSGTVFEPVDEYKGDFARTYFYFTTRYMNTSVTSGGGVFGSTFGNINSWCIDLYLKWSRQDPVSQKEITRNNAIYAFQHNRNPFIDYPMLAEHIWGTKKGTPWSITSGINDLKIEFSVSPNPASKFLNVKTDEQNTTYRIISLNGMLVESKKLNTSGTISIEQLNDGMYFIELQMGNRKSIKKFVVNN